MKIKINQEEIIQNSSVDNLIASKYPGQTIVIPEMQVKIVQHTLSVPSTNTAENKLYTDQNFSSPGLILEKLPNHYWFPTSGFLINKKGEVWRHSVLGQYGDPNFTTTNAVFKGKHSGVNAEFYFHEYLLHRTRIFDQPLLITSHYASHNFGHFMLDMVPLIQLGAKLKLKMASRPLLDWQKTIYRRAGVDPEKVEIFTDEAVFFREVFTSNRHNALSTSASSPNLRAVFKELLKNIPKPDLSTKLPKKIFLSRDTSKNRIISNRSELEKMLQLEGFEVIKPQLLSFDDQAILFSQADIIVSEFGAIMTNVVFCRENTKIIEIIPENQNDPWSVRLCAALNLEHITLFHKVNDMDRKSIKIANRIHTDIYFKFNADIALIKKVINQI